MQKVNIIIGRFQPFTTGHYLCAMEAMRKKGLKTVVCMINIPEYKVDKRHPFPSDMLISLYNNLFTDDPYIADVVTVPSADIVKAGEILRSHDYQIAAWTCGTDRYPQYSVQAARYHDQAGLANDFEVIKVPRDLEKDVSATKARNCLLNDDKAGFLSMIPPGSNEDILYNTLKEQIDIVYGNNESLERRVAKLEKLLNKDNIFEAKQVGTLYHVCTLDAYLKWIEPKDMLQASGEFYNYVYKGNEYISFTRDKRFVVKLLDDEEILIQIVIDGDKLSENYKIGPYNDFAFNDHIDAASDREQEECVKGPIKNLSKYVKEIRIDFRYLDKSVLKTLKRYASKLNNCVYYSFIDNYDREWDFTKFMRSKDKLQNGTPMNELIHEISSKMDKILAAES